MVHRNWKAIAVQVAVVVVAAAPGVRAQDAAPAGAPAPTVGPHFAEGSAWAVIGEGEARRIVLVADVAGGEQPIQIPECWVDTSAEQATSDTCPASFVAGEQLPAGWADAFPSTFALVTGDGWCVPTLGPPTVYNTAECMNGFQIGLPISGCGASAAVAFSTGQASDVTAWPAMHWDAVVFGESQTPDLTAIPWDMSYPSEFRTWWGAMSELFSYDPVTTGLLEGRTTASPQPWRTLSSGVQLPGEDCTDRIAQHEGTFLDTPEGLLQPSWGPVVHQVLWDDAGSYWGLDVGDSWLRVFRLQPGAFRDPIVQVRFRYDNEECASRPGHVWMEHSCAP